MVKIKFEYGNKEDLMRVIEESYFNDGNNGKLDTSNESYIRLPEDNIYNKILSGIDYSVKITNSDLIDGSMNFRKIEDNSGIMLIPESIYCVSKDGVKYSFY